eukprot:CAMPEP_0117045208 /NCGR_PEP_ID=MMETSP0472-20121206/31278_1 /TAXON_ID=693140 ORGANISM="Tiarina fusus, Strain LIS" /NCGR_SAMPLE_ID=MMETSP0472 /ASSEMBLY_ACC=CAM_ASM_000603 /LENGTH=965 /DNA_ID=CAMNT_0004757127 /DNA_START=206 /DNA_END=3103 /DNA_ORIENTATION=+
MIEVMSQPSFTAKRVGYLAASQSFTDETDVLMLATNLFKKDIGSSSPYESGLAINCLSNVCNTDLARDLAPDLVALLSSSRVYVRKKAVLVLYKIFLRFPQALRPAFPRLKEKLEDPDMGVVCAATNVICELARKNPKNYLSLAPILFKILTSSSNNWMLIKLVKLFGSLTPLEPRLAKKLVEPLTNIMNSTSAMSLLYECILTCTIGLTAHGSVIRLCISKLRLFIEDQDQNLKYLGLLALHKLMKIAPKAVQEHKDTVLTCLDDEDVTIRLRALDLIIGMVNKKTLMDIVKSLMDRLDTSDEKYREELINKVITICAQGNYQFIVDFEWYINVLVELTHVQGTRHGKRISDQLLDVCIRVKIIREFGVANMVHLLHDTRLTAENPTENGICEVLYAASWIVGEFNEFASNHCAIIDSLLQPRISVLPGHIQAVNVQNAIKLFTVVVAKGNGDFSRTAAPGEDTPAVALQVMKDRLPLFTRSSDLETQERACFGLQLVELVESVGGSIVNELVALFSEPLNPVAEKAQRKVPVPAGLDLTQQIHTPPSSDDESDLEDMATWDQPTYDMAPKEDPQAREADRKKRKQRRKQDPFYLGGSDDDDDEQYPPVEILTGDMIDLQPGFVKGTVPTGKKKRPQNVQIITTEEMPEGATGSDSDDEQHAPGDDLFSGIDLNSAVRPDEELTTKSYPTPSVGFDPSQQTSAPDDREERRRRRKRKKEKRRKEAQGEGDLLGIDETKKQTPPSSIVLAGETKNMKLAYELGVNPSQPDKVMALFHIRAVSVTLSNLEFNISCPLNLKLVPPAELRPEFTIAPNTHNSHRLLLQFQSMVQVQKFKGKLSYSANGVTEGLDFQVPLPCSTFVQSVPISTDDFMKVSANLSSNTSKIRCSDARAGLACISETLHVQVVEITDLAMLYGRSTQNHHVCLFVKNQKGGFAIELKCTDPTFGSNLLTEIKAALKKLNAQ